MVATNTVAAGATNQLRDIKPPVVIPNGWLWLIWSVIALGVLVLIYLAWREWQKKKDQLPVEEIIPPHIRARRKLEAALGLIGQPREFCIMVSDTIRIYLEERFEFHAPERTTEEFLHELKQTDRLTPDQKESLGEFLNRCDLVKFARYEPGEPELRDLHGAALRLVEETEPVMVVDAPGAHSPEANKPETTATPEPS